MSRALWLICSCFLIGEAIKPFYPEAMEELVHIMSDVVSLHRQSEDLIAHIASANGIVTSNKLAGFQMYRKVFVNFLASDFPIRYINETETAIGVAHEAVNDAAEVTFELFEGLVHGILPSPRSDIASFNETKTSLCQRWTVMKASLASLRDRYGISFTPVLPKVPERMIDRKVTEYFDELVSLFNSIRELVQNSYREMASFDAWSNVHDALFSEIVGPHEGAIVFAISAAVEEFQHVRAMILQEDLVSVANDSVAFESLVQRIAARIYEVHRLVLSSCSPGGENPVTLFRDKLSLSIIPQWKRLTVRAAVLRSRVHDLVSKDSASRVTSIIPNLSSHQSTSSTERRRRKPIKPQEVEPTPLIDDAERERTLKELLEWDETQHRASKVVKSPSDRKPRKILEDSRKNLPDVEVIKEDPPTPCTDADESPLVAHIGGDFQEVRPRRDRRWQRMRGEKKRATASPSPLANGGTPNIQVPDDNLTTHKEAEPQSPVAVSPTSALLEEREPTTATTTIRPDEAGSSSRASKRNLNPIRGRQIHGYLARLGELTQVVGGMYGEIASICDYLAPLLWSSGDIQGAQNTAWIHQMAHGSYQAAFGMNAVTGHIMHSQHERK